MSLGSSYIGYIPTGTQESIKSLHREYLAAEQGSLLKENVEKRILIGIFAELSNRSSEFRKMTQRRQRILFAVKIRSNVEDLLGSMEQARVALYQARNVEGLDAALPWDLMSQVSTFVTSRAKGKLDTARQGLGSVKGTIDTRTIELIAYDAGSKLASIKENTRKLDIEDRNIMQMELVDIAYDIFKRAIDVTSAINAVNLHIQAKEVEKAQRKVLEVLKILAQYKEENYAAVDKELLDIVYGVWEEITRHVTAGEREGRRTW